MEKLNKKFSLVLFVIIILSTSIFGAKSFAVNHIKSATIHLKQDYKASIDVWYIGQANNINLQDLKKESLEDLNEKYGQAKQYHSSTIDKNSTIELTSLKSGFYYIREIENINKKMILTPILLEITDAENHFNIYAKVTEDKNDENGRKEFIKKSSKDKNLNLEGAVFLVTKKNGDKYDAIIRDGKDYLVTSGKDGRFSVEGLKYGEYYLWEVTAPKGYILRNEGIFFQIDGKISSEIIAIYNEPTNKVKIPNTGDLQLYILICSGFLLFLIGYFIVKENKK